MINVIHFPDTNSVEVTWLDDDGKQTRCHSYADVQMDMMEADLGEAAAEYADMIATVRANIKSVEPPSAEQVRAAIVAEIDSLERQSLLPRVTREFMLLQFAATAQGMGVDPLTNIAYKKVKELDDQITALRSRL